MNFQISQGMLISYIRLPAPTGQISDTIMSLLQDVLRHQTLDSIERRFDTIHADSDNSDDELVNVVCNYGFAYSTVG
jgi:hypothetical protein